MEVAIFPGSFDPVALGHLGITERANRLFNRLIVVVLENSEKHATSSTEERLTFLRSDTTHLSNVEITADHGLTVDFARKQEAVATVRGMRSVRNYEYELDVANMNQHIVPGMRAALLYTSLKFSYVSSSIIRELVKYGQDISTYVLKSVMEAFVNR